MQSSFKFFLKICFLILFILSLSNCTFDKPKQSGKNKVEISVASVNNLFSPLNSKTTDLHNSSRKDIDLFVDIFFFGSLLLMGFYHLGLFILRRKNINFLFFGLLSIIFAVRALIVGDMAILFLFPTMDITFLPKISFICLFLILFFFTLFYREIFPNEVNKIVHYAFNIPLLIFLTIFIFIPMQSSIIVLSILEIIGCCMALYYTYVIILAVVRKREGGRIILIGSLVQTTAGFIDFLTFFGVLNVPTMLSFGFWFFLLSQSLALALNFTRSFEKIEILSEELKIKSDELIEYNLNLEKKVEERAAALRESEEKYRLLFEKMLNGFLLLDVIYDKNKEPDDFKVVDINPEFEKLIGIKKEVIIEKSLKDIFPEIKNELMENAKEIAKTQLPIHSEMFVSNLKKYLEINSYISTQNRIAVITSDITLRKRAEKLLIEENEKLLVTLRALSDGVITADKDGRVILINDAAEKLLDCTKEEIIGRSVAELFLIIDQKTGDIVKNPIYWVLEKKTSLGLENNKAIIIKSKKNIMMEYNAAPIFDIEKKIIGVVLVFRDITENLRIQDELKKSQKLESIGILAGGIAHDFNNILVSILGNISLAKINTDIEDSNYHFLIDAEKGTVRAKELTQQLLTFAKGGDPVKETSSIEEIIKDSTIFVLRGSNVACSFSFLDDIWSVDIDKGQINQVIQNLIINAIQSMPSGGKIDINVENVILEEHSSIQLASGKYILISIRDRGTGISKEYIDKIFDPFFTTKTKGTGLGLSIVYSIIKKHNGAILVESTIGLGTTFFVYLPASIKQTNHIKTNKEKNEKIKNMTFSQKERILVMDDEESIRLVVGKMLNHLGYEVDFASDGEEAIDLYKKAIEYNKPFNCVIMDLTIPGGLGGKEAIEKLKEIDPTIKAIVSSGYSNDPVISNFKQYGFSEIIAKPFVMEELSEVLHKVISGDKYRSTNI